MTTLTTIANNNDNDDNGNDNLNNADDDDNNDFNLSNADNNGVDNYARRMKRTLCRLYHLRNRKRPTFLT